MTDLIPGGPKRLLIAGDTHGNYLHWKNILLPAAREHHVDGIVQLGDFGYWPLTRDGVDYLAWLSGELDDDDSWVMFVDGNHEDHKALLELQRRPDGFVEITDRILWAPRGQRWEWSGVRFLALGGAYSIDRHLRKLDSGRWGWFRQEVLTKEQAERAIADGPCDVLLTRDAPEATIPSLMSHSILLGGYRPSEASITPKLIQTVAEATRPRLLMHAHWHHFIDTEVPPGVATASDPTPTACRVAGLACDDMDGSWAVLDLPSLHLSLDSASS
jgi:predicted phosphodiesterase